MSDSDYNMFLLWRFIHPFAIYLLVYLHDALLFLVTLMRNVQGIFKKNNFDIVNELLLYGSLNRLQQWQFTGMDTVMFAGRLLSYVCVEPSDREEKI